VSAPVRPIHLPGAKALASVRQRTQTALVAWARQWVSGWQESDQRITALQVSAAEGVAQSPADEYEALRSATGCVWFRRAAGDRVSLSRAVVGTELMSRTACVDDWIAGIADQAWGTRNRALCLELLGAPVGTATPASESELPASLFAFGSGAVQLSCEPLGLLAIVDSAVWLSVPPMERTTHPLPKLAPLEQAAQRAAVRLEVVLGNVEVELGHVLDLRCGDVLRLQQQLDQSMAVLCEGKPLARAVLGESQGRKSVRIVTNHQ
jgi:flagellar motor switch/type III secretory pathway protein FliN